MQGLGPYSTSIKKAEKEIKEMAKKVNDLCGMYPSGGWIMECNLIKLLVVFCHILCQIILWKSYYYPCHFVMLIDGI